MKNIYERKISSEEASQGYFLVLKNKLPFFPQIGRPFSVKLGAKKKKGIVESYHCECQGADTPHEHYFVRWKGLAKGDRLIIKKVDNEELLYSFRVEENLQ